MPGSLAGLVGPNGAGKTTSLSMMTGLLRPDSGQILINGLDVWQDPPAAKAAIGVVPAEVRLFDRLSADPQPAGAVPGRAAGGRGPGVGGRDPPAADPVRRIRLDGAVLQSCHGTGRTGLRPRVDHRQGPDCVTGTMEEVRGGGGAHL